jgi:hypothetical protein
MPFQQVKNMPDGEPDVRIFFHGLLLLRSQDGEACEVGVHPNAANHTFSVEVRTKTAGKADVVHMRHFGDLKFRRPGVTIKVEGAARDAAFKFIPDKPFNIEEGQGEPEDFRWVANLEGGHFHAKPLSTSVFDTQHTIELKGGEYYFHAARRTEAPISRTGGGKEPQIFGRLASVVGAKVYLSAEQALIMAWHDGSRECSLLLAKPEAGTSHEIYINNSPLFEDPVLLLSPHDELDQYYKVIQSVGLVEQFSLKVNELPTRAREGSAKFDSARGSARIPCLSVVLDGQA